MKKLFALITIFSIIVSCTNKTDDVSNLNDFKEYIFNTTTGEISKASPIKVFFSKDVEGFELGQEITSDLFKITPAVKGKLVLVSPKLIVFTPENLLASETEYKVDVALDQLFADVPKEMKTFVFSIKTITPNFVVYTNQLQSYDENYQYITGEIKSADVLTYQEASKVLSANQELDDLKIKLLGTESSLSSAFQFTIDSIQRKEVDSWVNLVWDGSTIGVKENSGSSKIEIPGKSNFKVMGIVARQLPEQHLLINFSDPINKQQNLNGLITVENGGKIKFAVDGNVLKVYPSKRITGTTNVKVHLGIKNQANYKLKDSYEQQVVFTQEKPDIQIITNGVILPDSENLKFNFKAVNLKAVDVRVIKIFSNNVLQFLQSGQLTTSSSYRIRPTGRIVAKKTIQLVKNDFENDGKWKNYAIDLSELIKTEPGAIYRVELGMKQEYSLYQCGKASDAIDYSIEDNPILKEKELDLENDYWDSFDEYYSDYEYFGDYDWYEREDPCTESYFTYKNRDRRGANILATNLGAIIKKGVGNSYTAFVTDILTAEPVVGATVEAFNFQQQSLGTFKTSAEGKIAFGLDARAAFAIVSFNNQYTYVKLDDGNSLSLSKFNVSGKKIKKGIKGHIYAERGVWRPGDTIHAFFVLNDKEKPLPQSHPVKLEMRDPRGVIQFTDISTSSVNGFYTFKIPTIDTDPTGKWNAKVTVGGATFHKVFKIETVKPNRLKINLDFDQEILSAEQPIDANVDVKWLHGATASNLKTKIKLKLTEQSGGFENYPGYVFNDPIKEFDDEEIVVFDGRIDASGHATLSKRVDFKKNAPGMLKAHFLTQVNEDGGDFSTDVISKDFAPYSSFVGLKSPKSNRYGGSYVTDKNISFGIATVDAQGKPISRSGLVVKIYKLDWSWWWSSSYDNLASYVNREYSTLYKTYEVSTTRGNGTLDVNIEDNDSGRYLIRVTDPVSGHSTGRTAYFFRNWWSDSSQDGSQATMLVFNADKESYKVGETAKITFPSSAGANALVSVENSTRVVQTLWEKSEGSMTTVELPITEEMAPNVFVNISLIQPHASLSNDLPLRMYGVIPLKVENPDAVLYPEIQMPDELKSEEAFEVKVSEKLGRRMTYTVAIVEEGLLDLTRFKTPDLNKEFNKRESLGVKTWDIFDEVVGAFGGAISQVFAIGGDEDLNSKKATKSNRFDPVVKVLGPFVLEAGKKASHRIKMPNYVGSVRTMVVAGDVASGTYGKAEKATPVTKPLMVLASLPRKLSPGEEVTLPVTVFAMKKNIRNVNVTVKPSAGLSLLSNKTQQVKFDEPGEQMCYFKFKVLDKERIASIGINASGNGSKTSENIEVDVFNPNEPTTKVDAFELMGNKSLNHDLKTFGDRGTNFGQLEISTLPPINFTKRLEYLIRYPHGCVEQTTSSVFPQLYLNSIFDLDAVQQKEIESNINQAIERLSKFQLGSGGLSYWIGGAGESDWGTCYAGHFMLEAQKKGYALPITFMDAWVNYQKAAARDWDSSRYYSRLTQSYRLYTLALAGYPDLGAMNRLREQDGLSNQVKYRLAAAYALVGQKQVAEDLLSQATLDFGYTNSYSYSYGSVDRNRAMALETMLLLDADGKKELAEIIAERLSSEDWMSTQTTAYCLLSMAKMVEINGGKSIHVKFSINGQNETIKTGKPLVNRKLKINKGVNQLTVQNLASNLLYVRVINTGILPVGEEVEVKRNFGVYTTFKDADGNTISPQSIKQGKEFVAEVTVTNTDAKYVHDIALTEIFPSGWEIVNTRFTDFGSNTTNAADHIDIRDDRVNFYFSLKRNGSRTFKVKLNASYLGKYYLPGAQVEAMYDNKYFTRTKGSWVEVVE